MNRIHIFGILVFIALAGIGAFFLKDSFRQEDDTILAPEKLLGTFYNSCAPADGPAITFSVPTQQSQEYPLVIVSLYQGTVPSSFTFNRETTDQLNEGAISYCPREGACEDVTSAVVSFTPHSPERVEGSFSLTLRTEETMTGNFEAIRDTTHRELCG